MMEIITPTQSPTDEQYKDALSQHLGELASPTTIDMLATLVHCTKVLNGDAEGIKKDCATDLRNATGISGRAYQPLVDAFMSAISDGKATEMIQPFMVVDEPTDSVDESTDEDNIPDVIETPTEQPSVDVEPTLTESMVRAIVNDATASLMKKIRRELSKQPVVASPTPVAKATKPTTQPKVVEPTESIDESIDMETSGLSVKRRKPYTPSGWKDKQNYSVAVVYDQVDNGQLVAIVKGLTADEATASGRNSIRRHLIRAFDVSNGDKTLTKATQDKETWVAVAAEHGITDAVCDLFLTNPNKYVQQSRRTGTTRRSKLGITDTATFVAVANENIGTTNSVVVGEQSKPSLFNNDTTAPEPTVATVDANKVASLMQAGLSAEDAVKAAKLL